MRNANCKYDIRPCYTQSLNSALHDEKTGNKYLDFFGMFSSLPLGYNHSSLKTQAFWDDIGKVVGVKTSFSAFHHAFYDDFVEYFMSEMAPPGFTSVHFTCTGGLAVEAAIKTALFEKRSAPPGISSVVSFTNGFHGINSYGSFVTAREGEPGKRLSGMPDQGWAKVSTTSELEHFLQKGTKAVIVEPIQCTFGDIHLGDQLLGEIRDLCTQYGACLIFDEVQTGFFATGHRWYGEFLDVMPDIIVFGKKAQVSGILVNQGWASIFESRNVGRLCVTFDGDLVDMVRSYHILKAIKKYNLDMNAHTRGDQFMKACQTLPFAKNIRGAGGILAFDLSNRKKRDIFTYECFEKGLLFNATAERTIRFRPNLAVSIDEIDEAIDIMRKAGDAYGL